ncbi:MAG: PilZ domain-containing protein [Hyphomicrobiaceae bacterium]|nr:PilZ domain-containing protein [Hyphomicrobiaceae bacterium]
MQDERRQAPRRRCLQKTRIELKGHTSSFDALMRNHSATGARLDVTDARQIPPQFDLAMPEDFGGLMHAETVWAEPNRLGVHFIGKATGGPPKRTARRIVDEGW